MLRTRALVHLPPTLIVCHCRVLGKEAVVAMLAGDLSAYLSGLNLKSTNRLALQYRNLKNLAIAPLSMVSVLGWAVSLIGKN